MKEIHPQTEAPAPGEPQKKKKHYHSAGSKKIPALRTYQSDTSVYITKERITKARMAMIEEDARAKRGEARVRVNKVIRASIVPLLIGTLLLGGAFVFGSYSGIWNMGKRIPSDQLLQMRFLLPESKTAPLFIQDQSRTLFLDSFGEQASEATIGAKGYGRLAPVINTGTTTRQITTNEILLLLDAEVPSVFRRSVEETFDIGLVGLDAPQIYLVFRATHYENAVIGALEWEKTMPNDLILLLYPFGYEGETFGLWTTQTSGDFFLRVLEVFSNIEPVVVYGWVDRRYLIITSSISSFLMIAEHLSSERI